MDKIDKVLNKFLPKERVRLKQILGKINRGDFFNLDLVKLKGKHEIYRARQGNIRIIFTKAKETVKILTVERRADKTYNF